MSKESESRRPLHPEIPAGRKEQLRTWRKKKVSPNTISLLSIAFAFVSLVAFYLDYVGKGNHIVNMAMAIVGIQED